MDKATTPASYAVLYAGGDAPDPLPDLDRTAYTVAADGGLAHALRAGVRPNVIVGDLDSGDPEQVASAVADGAEVIRYPTDKDATDWELALTHLVERGHRDVLIVGGAGGRLDHLLANALVLAGDTLADLTPTWHVGRSTVRIARPGRPVTIAGQPREIVSLLAAGAPASGVTTTGLRWVLTDASLPPGTSLGVSNEMTGKTAEIAVSEGTLILIHTGSTS